jgi:hypothetical protein
VIAGATETQTQRRRELELCLWQFEFAPVPAAVGSARTNRGRAHQFRLCLDRMGLLFAAFGRYLSSRADLIPETLAEALAAIPDWAPPAAPDEVREMYSRELGCPAELAFRTFDPEPFQARLMWQAHRAVLGDAETMVKIVSPEISQRIADAEYLPMIEQPLAAFGVSPAASARAVADFKRGLSDLMTWEADREASRLLAQDAERFELLGPVHVYDNLSTPLVCVCGRWESPVVSTPAPELSRSLCLVWLRQALRGSIYPIEPSLGNVALGGNGRIVFPCGPFATLPGELKVSLWDYLLALAADDADLAASHLIAAMGSALTDWKTEELRRGIRQMVPSRQDFAETGSTAWSVDGQRSSQQMSEKVWMHWRLAEETSVVSDALICFFRGLFVLGNTARSLSPGREWLTEAVRDLRLLLAFEEIQDAMRPSQMANWLETFAEALVRMPERLDRVLAGAATGGTAPFIHPTGAATPETGDRAANRRARAVCLLLTLGGAGLLLHKIAASTGPGGVAIVALAFLAVGLFLLLEGVR